MKDFIKVVNDTWIFDYNIIIKLCPEYAQYCEDLNLQEENDTPYTQDAVPVVQQVDGPVHVANGVAQAIPGVVAPMGGRSITDEEELAIINEVHGVKTKSTNEGRHNNNHPEDRYDAYISVATKKEKEHPNWVLRDEYKVNRLTGIADPGVPLLPPPKYVLGLGSVVWYGGYLRYTFNAPMSDEPDIVIMEKRSLYIKPEKIMMVIAAYRFDRVQNYTAEQKGKLEFITFSEKTKGLYWTSKQPNTSAKRGRRYHNVVMRMGMREEGAVALMAKFPKRIIKQFIDELLRRAVRDLGPDIVLPNLKEMVYADPYAGKRIKIPRFNNINDNRTYAWTITAIMWQYKAQRYLPWVGDQKVYLENLSILLAPGWLGRLMPNADDESNIKKGYNHRHRILANIHKAVRGGSSPKVVTKAILGGMYKDLYHQILATYVTDRIHTANAIVNIEQLIEAGHVPKSVYHLFVATFKSGEDGFQHFNQLCTTFGQMRKHTTGGYDVVDKYINFSRRMFNEDNDPAPFYQFKDTLDMAKQLGLRLRLNKFPTWNHMKRKHDRLSEFMARDTKALYKAPIFLPFAHPDKLYGDKFKFVNLITAEELIDEAKQMKNCVASYSYRCFEGESIMFSMRCGRSWVTIELDGTTKAYEIRQKYTIGDFTIENGKTKDLIDEWHHDIVELHKDDPMVYQTIADLARDYIEWFRKYNKYAGTNFDEVEKDEKELIQSVLTKSDSEMSRIKTELLEAGVAYEEVIDYATAFEQAVKAAEQQRQSSAA